MKRSLLIISVLLGFFVISSNKVMAQESIEDFRVNITINQDGTISVKEEILYSFGANFRHGIFRTIPLTKTNDEGKKFLMDIKGISVANELGKSYLFTTEGRGEKEIKIGDPNTKISGSHKYMISYEISGALTYFDDFDELYWNAIGTDWDVGIKTAQITVNLPAEMDAEEVKLVCYTGAQDETSQNCLAELQNKKEINYKLRMPLNPKEGFTVAVSFPKGYVSVLEPATYRESLKTYLLIAGAIIALIIGNIVLPIRKIASLIKESKNLNDKKRIVAAWFDPPKRKDGTFFSPGETLGLAEKLSTKSITSEIIYLAQKGYLKIVAEGKKDFSFEKLKEADNSFTEHQKVLYMALFGTNDKVTTKDIKRSKTLGTKYNDMITKIYKQLFEEGVSGKNIQKLREGNGAKAFFSLFIGGIVSTIVYSIASSTEKKLTDAGIQSYSEAVSLKNFLSSQEDQLEFQAKEQMFFERLLPYATAFGVEKVWAKRFQDITFEKTDWYEGDFNAMQFAVISSAINSSVSRSVSSANRSSSSGFSSGSSGGSSGGGGGGGGGGSW